MAISQRGVPSICGPHIWCYMTLIVVWGKIFDYGLGSRSVHCNPYASIVHPIFTVFSVTTNPKNVFQPNFIFRTDFTHLGVGFEFFYNTFGSLDPGISSYGYQNINHCPRHSICVNIRCCIS